jgi:hypothetical protein
VKSETLRLANDRIGTLWTRLRTAFVDWINTVSGRNIHFRKYRVAPRLGTNTVRRRLLLGLHANEPFTATETSLA